MKTYSLDIPRVRGAEANRALGAAVARSLRGDVQEVLRDFPGRRLVVKASQPPSTRNGSLPWKEVC